MSNKEMKDWSTLWSEPGDALEARWDALSEMTRRWLIVLGVLVGLIYYAGTSVLMFTTEAGGGIWQALVYFWLIGFCLLPPWGAGALILAIITTVRWVTQKEPKPLSESDEQWEHDYEWELKNL